MSIINISKIDNHDGESRWLTLLIVVRMVDNDGQPERSKPDQPPPSHATSARPDRALSVPWTAQGQQ